MSYIHCNLQNIQSYACIIYHIYPYMYYRYERHEYLISYIIILYKYII